MPTTRRLWEVDSTLTSDTRTAWQCLANHLRVAFLFQDVLQWSGQHTAESLMPARASHRVEATRRPIVVVCALGAFVKDLRIFNRLCHGQRPPLKIPKASCCVITSSDSLLVLSDDYVALGRV